MHTPKVTVLMTVYNGMPYLPQAIESILGQTWTDFEFLIVNDCSTDNSREIILSYNDPRIRLLDNAQNIRQTKSLNRGLAHARSDLVARMDADDVSHPRRLELQVAYLREHADVVAVGTNLRFIDSNGKVIQKMQRPLHDVGIRWTQFFSCPISCGAVMFRKNVIWEKLGGFDESIKISQDWELWSRVPREHKLANLPEMLYDVRRHPDADSIALRSVANLEDARICKANPQRILGVVDDSEEWVKSADLLVPCAHDARRKHPDKLLEVVEQLYSRFCDVYPDAPQDPDAVRLLSAQYFRVACSAGLGNPSITLRALRLAWPVSPKRFYVSEFAHFLAVCCGARQIRRWILKVCGRTEYRKQIPSV